jgi:hypothetical protein
MNDKDPTMADPATNHSDGEACAPTRRRGADLLTLAAGLAALGIASTALFGSLSWLPEVDVRWVLATVAIVVGLALVIGSIRPQRR